MGKNVIRKKKRKIGIANRIGSPMKPTRCTCRNRFNYANAKTSDMTTMSAMPADAGTSSEFVVAKIWKEKKTQRNFTAIRGRSSSNRMHDNIINKPMLGSPLRVTISSQTPVRCVRVVKCNQWQQLVVLYFCFWLSDKHGSTRVYHMAVQRTMCQLASIHIWVFCSPPRIWIHDRNLLIFDQFGNVKNTFPRNGRRYERMNPYTIPIDVGWVVHGNVCATQLESHVVRIRGCNMQCTQAHVTLRNEKENSPSQWHFLSSATRTDGVGSREKTPLPPQECCDDDFAVQRPNIACVALLMHEYDRIVSILVAATVETRPTKRSEAKRKIARNQFMRKVFTHHTGKVHRFGSGVRASGNIFTRRPDNDQKWRKSFGKYFWVVCISAMATICSFDWLWRPIVVRFQLHLHRKCASDVTMRLAKKQNARIRWRRNFLLLLESYSGKTIFVVRRESGRTNFCSLAFCCAVRGKKK